MGASGSCIPQGHLFIGSTGIRLSSKFQKLLNPLKNPRDNRIRIVNPVAGGSAFTSLRKAQEYRDRGRAVFVGDGSSIRFLDSAESVAIRQARKERLDDEAYWEAIARQLGGSVDQLRFIIKRSATPPTMPGGPEGAAIMAFIPVIEHV